MEHSGDNNNCNPCNSGSSPFQPPSGPLGVILDEEVGSHLSPRKSLHNSDRFPIPLPWNIYWDRSCDLPVEERKGTFRLYFAGSTGPVILCLHGAGYTSLTWSLLASKLKEKCQVIALDLRGHGQTQTDDDSDLSAETLSRDVVAIWEKQFSHVEDKPPLVIMGHSMGGAIATRAAALNSMPSLKAIVVVDVVEGTALASLPHMISVLNKRPREFYSLECAVNWALCSKTTKNREAACVSVPSMLLQDSRGYWVWRTHLKESAGFWREWYEGLSDMFLALSVPKLLALVGTDRMDKPLTIGQMQGKFQLAILPAAGHAVQEDEASKLAETILYFISRFRVGQEMPDFLITKKSEFQVNV